MSDIATIWSSDLQFGDWQPLAPGQTVWSDGNGTFACDPGGLADGNDLVTAVLISLFSDAEAGPDDVIPDGSGDPRGWWGGAIGSKIWLRMRSKATPIVLALVQDDITQALAWLISDGVVASTSVTTEWTRPGLLGALVVLARADGTRVALAFARLWENR